MRLCDLDPYIRSIRDRYQELCSQRLAFIRRSSYVDDEEQDARDYKWDEIVSTATDLYEAAVRFLNEKHYIRFYINATPSYLYADNVTFTLNNLDEYETTPNIGIGNSYEVISNIQEYTIPWKDDVNCHILQAILAPNSWINVEVITKEEFEEKTANAISHEEALEKFNAIVDAVNNAKRSCRNIRRNNPKYQHINHSIKQFQLYVKYLKILKGKFDDVIYQETFSNLLPPELASCVNPSNLERRNYHWSDSFSSNIKQRIIKNGGMPEIDLL